MERSKVPCLWQKKEDVERAVALRLDLLICASIPRNEEVGHCLSFLGLTVRHTAFAVRAGCHSAPSSFNDMWFPLVTE